MIEMVFPKNYKSWLRRNKTERMFASEINRNKGEQFNPFCKRMYKQGRERYYREELKQEKGSG